MVSARRKWERFSPAIRYLGRGLKLAIDDRGVAALEFALIAPVMLGLYLSTVITTKAYMASRKAALVARTLADITSRQQIISARSAIAACASNPCVNDTDVASYFAAATAIMAPFPTGSLKMTLSRIDVIHDASHNLWAYTKWSVINNGGVPRRCSTTGAMPGPAVSNPYVAGSPSAPAPSATSLLSKKYYPLTPETRSTTSAGYEGYLSQQYTLAGAPAGFLIVADVVYTYSPGFSFNIFNWSNVTSITSGWTQAFWSRTSQQIDGTQLTTNATQCADNDPGNSDPNP
jgi:hypothetical protein